MNVKDIGRRKAYDILQSRWGGCRPPQTASQCAKLVVLRPLSGKDGNRDNGYDDWRGFGKICLSGARRIDDRTVKVSKEAVAAEFCRFHDQTAPRHSCHGSVRQRALL